MNRIVIMHYGRAKGRRREKKRRRSKSMSVWLRRARSIWQSRAATPFSLQGFFFLNPVNFRESNISLPLHMHSFEALSARHLLLQYWGGPSPTISIRKGRQSSFIHSRADVGTRHHFQKWLSARRDLGSRKVSASHTQPIRPDTVEPTGPSSILTVSTSVDGSFRDGFPR